LLEGDRVASLTASDELLGATFRDPEGWYHLARQLGYLSETDRALVALSRTVEWGFFCFPAMATDPWLDSLRGHTKFKEILRQAQTRHEEARDAFNTEGGRGVLS
jgi:hypothetical protein